MASIAPRTPATWISDEKISTCTQCASEFTIVNRRHHCRSCGNIFCSNCCYQMQSLPSYLPSTHRRYCDGKRHRVCNSCLRDIVYIKRNKKWIYIFSILPLPLQSLFVIRATSKSWKTAIDSVLGVFKSIHLKVGYQKWTSIERRIIFTHWKEFKGHSRLMTQSIRAMTGIIDISTMVRHYHSSSDRLYPCTALSCINCTDHMSVFDIMEILCCFPGQRIIESQEMEAWIGQAISAIPKKWIQHILPWLLQPHHPPSKVLQRILANNLIPVCVDDKTLAFCFYFNCNFLVESRTSYYTYYSSLMDRFLQMTPFKEDLCKSHQFLRTIKHPNKISEYDFNNICLPFDSNVIIRDVQVVNIKQLNTHTMPWVIPIETYNHGVIKILLKHDDLRKDYFVMNIIKMIKEMNNNMMLKSYNILPVTEDFGIVEIIPNCSTLQDINKTCSLTNWIVKNNINKSMLEIRNEFILSCASNCILSFMLGIGDRNQGNILVSEEGRIAHIDFSYLLGTDPKWSKMTEMRITPGMVDLLGGIRSEHFNQLKKTCSDLFSDMKQYTYFWYALLRYLSTADPPIEPHHRNFDSIELHIENRLMPNISEETVAMVIEDVVDSNSDSKIATWVDSFHSFKSSMEEMIFNISIT